MKDIDIAKKELREKDLTLAVVKHGKIIYNSKDRGVLPIYQAVTNPSIDAEGASVADKVTGKGAALLCAYGKIKELHTGTISKSAAKVLESADIEFSYDNKVEYIKNRKGDGGCPVETLSRDIENPEKVLEPIKGFLIRIGAIQ